MCGRRQGHRGSAGPGTRSRASYYLHSAACVFQAWLLFCQTSWLWKLLARSLADRNRQRAIVHWGGLGRRVERQKRTAPGCNRMPSCDSTCHVLLEITIEEPHECNRRPRAWRRRPSRRSRIRQRAFAEGSAAKPTYGRHRLPDGCGSSIDCDRISHRCGSGALIALPHTRIARSAVHLPGRWSRLASTALMTASRTRSNSALSRVLKSSTRRPR